MSHTPQESGNEAESPGDRSTVLTVSPGAAIKTVNSTSVSGHYFSGSKVNIINNNNYGAPHEMERKRASPAIHIPTVNDTMQLVLSTGDPYNAVYTTTEGRVLYKVVSRSRKLPPRRWSTVDKAVVGKSSTGDKQDHFKRIGEVEFHTILSSVITFRGVTQDVDTFFRKGSSTLPLTLGSHRIFVGPDNKEYRWKLAHTKPVLFRHSDKARVAKFLPQDTTTASDSRRAMLEIYAAGQHMVDAIVVTLAYIERLRQDRESILSL